MAFKKFSSTFWISNVIELFERWAWYGLYVVLALYLTQSTDTGALGFSQEQKGSIMGIVTGILYLLPIFTGAIADRIGYKKVLLVALAILSSGYLFLNYFTSYTGFFITFLYVGIGASLFKPIIAATIAKVTTKENSSIGFGIFYMMVNIGAFIGPIFASKLRENGWHYVFYMSSAAIAINFFIALFFYKEPTINKSGDPFFKSLKLIFKNIFTVLKDFRYLIFLFFVTGFWTMYNQLFYTLPVFIDQWIDTSIIYNWIYDISPVAASKIGTESKIIAPEMMTNIDAFYIISFQILVSAFVKRFKPLSAMTGGIIIASIGLGLTFVTQNGFYLFISILMFGLGEMATSPKVTEYIGKIAPADKTALYIGTSYLPLAGGNILAGILSGTVYTNIADKVQMIRIELITRGIVLPDISDSYTLNHFFADSCNKLNMNMPELTNYLWDKYNPSNIWLVFTGIGLFSAAGMFVFDKFIAKKKN